MRFNKDFIAELLAADSQAAEEQARRLMNSRAAETRPGFKSTPARNLSETTGEQVAAVRLRDQPRLTAFIIGAMLAWLFFGLINPVLTLDQSPLRTAESRARHASQMFLPKVAALRPASNDEGCKKRQEVQAIHFANRTLNRDN